MQHRGSDLGKCASFSDRCCVVEYFYCILFDSMRIFYLKKRNMHLYQWHFVFRGKNTVLQN